MQFTKESVFTTRIRLEGIRFSSVPSLGRLSLDGHNRAYMIALGRALAHSQFGEWEFRGQYPARHTYYIASEQQERNLMVRARRKNGKIVADVMKREGREWKYHPITHTALNAARSAHPSEPDNVVGWSKYHMLVKLMRDETIVVYGNEAQALEYIEYGFRNELFTKIAGFDWSEFEAFASDSEMAEDLTIGQPTAVLDGSL